MTPRKHLPPRRRALAVTGGTVAAGGLTVAGYRSAFTDTAATGTDAATPPLWHRHRRADAGTTVAATGAP
ncbi:hypothetical protein AB0L59_34970 [Streptomyces sp. NPDC052109]|uniref:hypothetical protein n=1 Tax=Streptomyces sp. NPDC052109 TaxID=3155527 RepID=UPI0034290BF7